MKLDKTHTGRRNQGKTAPLYVENAMLKRGVKRAPQMVIAALILSALSAGVAYGYTTTVAGDMHEDGSTVDFNVLRHTFNTGPLTYKLLDNTDTNVSLVMRSAADNTTYISLTQTWSTTNVTKYFYNRSTGRTSFPANTYFYFSGCMTANSWWEDDPHFSGNLTY